MSTTITFGKYKNSSIEEIFAKDPGYCRWLNNQPNLVNEEVKNFLMSKLSQDDGDYVMNWGKYKGRKLKTVHQLDPEYTDWLRNNNFVKEKCSRLVAELAELH